MAVVYLVFADIRHVSYLLAEEADESKTKQPRLFERFAHYGSIERLTVLDGARRHLNARLRCIWLAEHEQPVGTRNVGEHLSLMNRHRSSMLHDVATYDARIPVELPRFGGR